MVKPRFFKDQKFFRKWLAKYHQTKNEQWVGYYKKGSGKASMTWSESVDQALCYGWIDGLRKSIDDISYMVRFTPRKKGSHWSLVNLKKVDELKKLGLMEPAGMAIFEARDRKKVALAAHEQKQVTLDPAYLKELKSNPAAWQDFESRTASYRKQCIWWVMSAKKKETQLSRLATLIICCAEGKKVPPLRWQK